MRLKLVLLASLIAALVAVLLSIGMTIAGLGSIDHAPDSAYYRSFSWIQLAVFLPPFLTALLAGVFVHRHTATRRKLQGAMTAVLVVLYCLAAFVLLKLFVG